jgi:hypothetical protein
MVYSKSEIKTKIQIALEILYEKDMFLLKNDVNERSISHKLAEYIQQQFSEYHVDCEYNRVGNLTVDEEYFNKKLRLYKNIKCLNGETVYPDIIIHKRGQKNNLLVIEIKKIKDKNRVLDDYKKILGLFTSKEFEYKFGLFLQLGKKNVRIFDLYGNNSSDLERLKKRINEG